jgi:hypothetical protein
MPTGKSMGYGLLLATKSSSIVAKGVTINRKTSKDPKQNESIENKSRNMHGRDKKEEHEGER